MADTDISKLSGITVLFLRLYYFFFYFNVKQIQIFKYFFMRKKIDIKEEPVARNGQSKVWDLGQISL